MMGKTVGAGISGMSVYVPRWRVSLEAWCGWTGGAWDKIRAVVGHGFRVPGPDENVYTMAAYERGSSGEPTQGAGAVAMLVEAEAKLVAVDLDTAGSASDYRGPDFRKPMARFFLDGYAAKRQHDFPVFSGKYSTYAYLDE